MISMDDQDMKAVTFVVVAAAVVVVNGQVDRTGNDVVSLLLYVCYWLSLQKMAGTRIPLF